MIVSDATILITLINIDKFDILKRFVNKIYITKEVYSEVSQKIYAKNFIDSFVNSGFIEIREFKNKQLYKEFRYILDKGESSSMVLSLEQNLPLIIDEKRGRGFAKSKGIEIIGLIGIIKYLYTIKELSENDVLEITTLLNKSNFRISKKLLELILQHESN